jgi:hypothetical protein
MKQTKYIFIFFLFAVIVSLSVTAANAQNSGQSKQENPDKIRIVNITAASPVIDGAENEFTVEIEYTLESMDEGSLAIGFNVTNFRAFRMMTRKITLKAKVIPKDWKENGDFSVMANLSPYPLPQARYTPMAGTTMVIDFAQ